MADVERKLTDDQINAQLAEAIIQSWFGEELPPCISIAELITLLYPKACVESDPMHC